VRGAINPTDEKDTNAEVEKQTTEARVVRGYHGAHGGGDTILAIIRSGHMIPKSSQIFLSKSEFAASFMHGADTKRRASFVIEVELTFSPQEVEEVRKRTQGVDNTLLLQTDAPIPLKVVTLYVRKPDPDAEEGERRFKFETIRGQDAIVAYLEGG
jgi:hypothetical protein